MSRYGIYWDDWNRRRGVPGTSLPTEPERKHLEWTRRTTVWWLVGRVVIGVVIVLIVVMR